MPDILFSTFSPELLAVAPNCPVPTMVREIRMAARFFCERSTAFRVRIDSQTVAANALTIDLTTPNNTELYKPITLVLNQARFLPSSETIEDMDYANWRAQGGTGTYEWINSPGVVNQIVPVPTPTVELAGDFGLSGEIAVRPTRTATALPDYFIDEYYDGLIAGAKARLLRIPSAAWYNRRASMDEEMMFREAIEDAKSRAENNHSNKKRTVTYGGL